jgi:ribosomal protein S12 methylthiotransferase accessory factor
VFDSDSKERIYRVNSNGSACHSNLTHAILNAAYELIERDAMMIAWMNRLSMPMVNLSSSDPDPWGVRQTFDSLDLEFAHVDISTDLDIPVLLGVLRDRRNPDFFMTNMVAALDPHRLLAKLYRELVQFTYPYFINRETFVTDITKHSDPDHVMTFRDHLGFYQSRDKNIQASFLTDSVTSHEFDQSPFTKESTDTTQELNDVLQRISTKGYHPIVVNCTTPLLKHAGLHAIKVLIPGLQPLNAGHRLRVLGGKRLYSVPRILGFTDHDTIEAALNPMPHPHW